MTHRQRVLAAIDGRETDRIPADYYGTPEANEMYLRELALPDLLSLIDFLDTDVVHASPGAGRVSIRREKQYLQDVEDVDELRRICQDVPAADELIDNTPILQAREARPHHAVYVSGPGSFFLGACTAFGYETALMHHALRPDLIQAWIELGIQYAFDVIDKLHRDVGDAIDILSFEDDFATQIGLYISREMFVEFYKPAFTIVIAHARKQGYRAQYHCCGAASQLIPDFIEMGAEMLDPIQVSAAGMDLSELAERFKGQICFHGGIDTQTLLPFGRPDQVRDEIARLIRLLGTTRAFVAPSQNFLPDIPTENLLAMYRAPRTA